MMFSLPEYTQRLRLDLRRATINNQTITRAHLLQKQKAETLEEIIKKKEKRIKELEKENWKLKQDKEKLKEQVEKLTKTKSRYQVSNAVIKPQILLIAYIKIL